MRFYDLVVFVHVLSAVALIGAGILATPAVNTAIERAPTVSELRRWLTFGKPLGTINPISSLTLLASGIYLSSMGDWWGSAWVQVAVALWIVNTVLASTVVKPAMKTLAQAVFTRESDVLDPELDRLRRSPRLELPEDIMVASDLGVLFLMVVKPTSYLLATLAIAAAQLLFFAARSLRRRTAVGAEPAIPISG